VNTLTPCVEQRPRGLTTQDHLRSLYGRCTCFPWLFLFTREGQLQRCKMIKMSILQDNYYVSQWLNIDIGRIVGPGRIDCGAWSDRLWGLGGRGALPRHCSPTDLIFLFFYFLPPTYFF
jgi:hypothetical protein